MPTAGYTPGTTYSMVATVTRANHVKYGFQISPQNTSGTPLGTLVITDATNTQLTTTNTNYVEHTVPGTLGTTGFHTWTFNWTAPAAGSGSFTFYGAFNITNDNSLNTGDTINVYQYTVSENTTAGIKTISAGAEAISIYPNPCKSNFSVEPKNVNEKQNLQMFDLTGKLVLTQSVFGKTNIDVSSLNEGVYTVNIFGSYGIVNKKIIVTK
ncbi:MAG: choice-of-anchor V domain-containing protein [Bacteroidia bacterium]